MVITAHHNDTCEGHVPRRKQNGEDNAKLIPERGFEKALKKVPAVSKEDSDRQVADFQASNKARRETTKKSEMLGTGRYTLEAEQSYKRRRLNSDA